MEENKLRIAALQGVLSANGDYRARVDGIVGNATKKAIAKSPTLAKKAADVIGGDVLQALIDGATSGQKDAMRAIRQAADELGVDATRYLAKAATESSFNPDAVNGSYRGLFQMGAAAWEDANDVLRGLGLPGLGVYVENWSDPLANSRAAMAYEMALGDQIRKQGWRSPLSESQLYLAHQQGAAGLVRLLKAAEGRILEPDAESAMLRAMRSNPPQDGQGVTVNPREFLSRWENVYASRLADAATVA